jgi:beta-lactamase regulating signal transducer with metallopeptidase domain
MENNSMNYIFLTVLNNALSVSWLIIAVILIRFVFKKTPKWIMCIMWGLVALRLIMPFANIQLESVFSLIPSAATVPVDIEYSQTPQIDTGIQTINSVVNPILENNFTPVQEASVNPLQIVISIFSIVWICGVVLMLAYLCTSFLVLKKKVAGAECTYFMDEKIYECRSIVSPFILGVLCPKIYFPPNMEEEDKSCVLAHEKAHIKRGDHLWKPLGFLILSIYWFNPLCWAAYILLCRDIEYACDERATKDMDKEQRADYCQVLLDCSTQLKSGVSGRTEKIVSSCPVAFGEVGVKGRIKSVIKYRKPALVIVLAALIVCLLAALCFMTNPAKKYFLKNVEPEEVIRISVFDGNNGWGFNITDEDEIAFIVNNIKSIPADRSELSLGYSGYSFRMTFADSKGSTITEFILNDGSIRKDPFFYILDCGDCFDYLKELEEKYTGIGGEENLQDADVENIDDKITDTTTSDAADEKVLSYLKEWADAFATRDGNKIISLSSEEVQDSLEEREWLTRGEYVSFGFSSPMVYSNEDDSSSAVVYSYSQSDNSAIIRYYVWTSDPHISVWTENLKFSMADDSFTVTEEELHFYDDIASGIEYDEAYPYGIDGTPMDYSSNDLGEYLNNNAMLSSNIYYKDLFEPEGAARVLLNLINNENKVKIETTDAEADSGVVVKLTFTEDGKERMINMIQTWGENGIWIPQNFD